MHARADARTHATPARSITLVWGTIPLAFAVNMIYFTVDHCSSEMEAPFGDDQMDVDLAKIVRRIEKFTAAILSLYVRCLTPHPSRRGPRTSHIESGPARSRRCVQRAADASFAPFASPACRSRVLAFAPARVCCHNVPPMALSSLTLSLSHSLTLSLSHSLTLSLSDGGSSTSPSSTSTSTRRRAPRTSSTT